MWGCHWRRRSPRRAAACTWSTSTKPRSRRSVRGESYIEDVPSAAGGRAELGGQADRRHRLRRDRRLRRDPDLRPHPALGQPRARPLDPGVGNPGDRPAPARRAPGGARVDHLPGHHPRDRAPDPGGGWAGRRPRLQPGDVARADRSRPHRLHRQDHTQDRRRADPGLRRARAGAVRRLHRDARSGLVVRRRRADQAAREHLSQRQHRPRQRAGDAVRADGSGRLGGRRRGRHQAVWVHALHARPRPGRPLPARRPVLPVVARPPVRLRRPSSSSWPARSTSRCPTTAQSGSRRR